ncbi:toll/interleukin-1 receptor domain-containing protein [Mucilaginibacter endophyticus]|uniref:toll/interleukin-1 receptor domain-containing protein n=1 Tax=Mucilaginibacter endophyticus TaxID=2675003 RepID=UPI000E0D9166|nr:toll/interleukin-1 receptor domain-containing protein [Mucilaginibacter endophyticus]
MYRNGIFISYSHVDEKWLNIILTFLKPYTRGEKISVWSDKEIKPGTAWRDEIEARLLSCRVAILLVSPNFLASDFIMENELPLILERSSNGELILYWIAISHSAYKTTALVELQSANNPSNPLDQLEKAERDKVLVQITENIANAINLNAIGNVLKIIDDFLPQQKAFIDGKEFDNRERNYSTLAYQQHNRIELKNRDNYVMETITADDLERLDRDSKILIRSYEGVMKDLFERWVELRPKSYSRDPIIRQDACEEMSIIRKGLCEQLNSILDYLLKLHKNLDDHYHHVRHICKQP